MAIEAASVEVSDVLNKTLRKDTVSHPVKMNILSDKVIFIVENGCTNNQGKVCDAEYILSKREIKELLQSLY